MSQLNGIAKSIVVSIITLSLFGCGINSAPVPPEAGNLKPKATEPAKQSAYILCDFSVSQDKESVKKIISNADELFRMGREKKYKLSFYNISAPQYAGPFFEYKLQKRPSISKPSERDSLKKAMERSGDSLHRMLGQLSNNSSYKVTCIIRTLEQIANSLARTVAEPDKESIKIIILSDLLEDCSYPEGRINIDHAEFEAARKILSRMPKPGFTFSKYKNIEIILVASSERNWNIDKGHGFWKAALARFDYDLTGPIATDLPEL